MKKIVLLSVLIGFLINTNVNGQACGTSGPSICSPTVGDSIGFYPSDTALPCVNDGQAYNQVISLLAPATVLGNPLDSIHINSITNLPCGLCWATGKTSDNIPGGGAGCIRVSGASFEAPGEYDVKVYATAYVHLFGSSIPIGPLNVDSALGLAYYIRVTLPGNACAKVDTSSPGGTASTAGSITTPSITGNASICPGGSTTLTATGDSYYAYAWSNGTFTASTTVSAAGTYTVTVYDNCTSASASVSVTTKTASATITAGGPTTFCQGDSVLLTSSTASSYLWSSGATTKSIEAKISGGYTVTVTTAAGCTASSTATMVTVNQNPSVTITAGGPTIFCQGGSVNLSVPPGYSYLWSNAATTKSINVTATGNYSVVVTNTTTNCSATTAPTSVTVNPNPSTTITAGGPTTFCQGDSVSLSAPAGFNYVWNTTATTQSIQASTTGSYTVVVTNGTTSCSGTSSATVVTVNPNPTATITPGGPTTFCQGGSVILSAPAGFSYLWSSTATTQTITANATGSYSVTVTNTTTNCSAASSPTSVTVNPGPSATITAGGPTSFCPGGSVTLSAPSGLGYLWSSTETTQSISASQNGPYTVTVTDQTTNCTASSSTSITLYPVTSIGTEPLSQGTCVGGDVNFTVAATGNNLSYQWYNNGNLSEVTSATYNIASAQVSDTGIYVAVVTGTCGKDTSTAAVLSVSQTIVISQQPQSQTVCSGSPVTFTVIANGNGTKFQWLLNGQTLEGADSSIYSIVSADISDTGTYTCQIQSSCGDTTSDGAYLTVLPVSVTNLYDTTCANQAITFNGQSYDSTGTYTVTLQNTAGCDSIVTLYLTVNPSYSTLLTDTICAGDSVVFNGQTLNASGVYPVTLSSVSGCDSTVTFTLTVTPPTINNISQSICAGDSFSFNGQSLMLGGTYSDTTAGSNTCDSITVLTLTVNNPAYDTVTASICNGSPYNFNGVIFYDAGSYNDTLSGSNTCDSIVTLVLVVNNPVFDTVTANICAGDSFNFNGTYISQAGNYTDTLEGSNTCDSIVTVALVVNQPVFADTTVTICSGSTYSFNGVNLDTAGTYKDTVAGSNTCDSITTLTLQVVAPAQLSWEVSDTIMCNNDTHIIAIPAASPAGGTYSGAGVSGSNLTADTSGTYSVTYTYSSNGCTDSISKTFIVDGCTGINEINLANTIHLYPNPVSELLIIESDMFAGSNPLPQMYNVSGQLVAANYTRQANKLVYNTSVLVPGIYSVKFSVNGTIVSKRFVKID